MLSHPLANGCHLALIEKRHARALFDCIEKNRENYKGVLHFVDFILTEKDAEAFVAKLLLSVIEAKAVCWGIWDGSKIIGVMSARDIDEDQKSAEIGYFIDKDYEGRGLVSESAEILIDYLFREFDVERLVLGCDVRNERSQRIAARFGFRREGIARKGFVADGKFQDCYIHSLLREEYLAAREKG